MATPRFVEPSTVAELLKGPMREETVVLDVRDEVGSALSEPYVVVVARYT